MSNERSTTTDDWSSTTCFVIGPIGNRHAEPDSPEWVTFDLASATYDRVIRPACSPFRILPVRADEISEPGEIPEQIVERLRDSDLVIADLTGGNPNVMYELGLRHASGRVTIQIGEHGRLPFDVNTIRTIQFARNPAGYDQAVNDLHAALTASFDKGMSPVTATRVFRRSGSKIKLEPSVLDLLPRQVTLASAIEIDTVRSRMAERLKTLSREFHAIECVASAFGAELHRLESKGNIAIVLRTLFDELRPNLSRAAIDAQALLRFARQIDEALRVELPTLRQRKDGAHITSLRGMLNGHQKVFTVLSQALRRFQARYSIAEYADLLATVDGIVEITAAGLRELGRIRR